MYDADTLALSPCKAIGHDWDATPNQRRARWGTLLTLRCTCCTARREDTIDLNGNVSVRTYTYTDAYENLPVMTKAEWRKAYFQFMKRAGRVGEISVAGVNRAANVVPIRQATAS